MIGPYYRLRPRYVRFWARIFGLLCASRGRWELFSPEEKR